MTTELILEGVDGAGKTTVANLIREQLHPVGMVEVKDRGELTKLTTVFPLDLPDTIENQEKYIVLNCHPETALKRLSKRGAPLDEWELSDGLFFFYHAYRMLASKYNLHYIDTTNLTPGDTMFAITEIITGSQDYRMPCPDHLSEEAFEVLPKVVSGLSKDIRDYSSGKHKYHVSKYIPSVYSHTMQRAGMVPGTDEERRRMTRMTLLLFWFNEIQHSYVYVGKNYTLCEVLAPEEIPPIEVIGKYFYNGTDKHRYYKLHEKTDRFGKPICEKEFEFQTVDAAGNVIVTPYYRLTDGPYIRMDLRNPNHDPDTGKPWGDYNLPPFYANKFIDTFRAEETAHEALRCISEFMNEFGITLVDCCLMLTTNGEKLFGEFSQDCCRVLKRDTDENSTGEHLSKDIWRAGGSSDLVLEKYKLMSEYIEKYSKTYWNLRMGEWFQNQV